jgi:hypothetical protein
MIKAQRQTMWQSFSDELEKVAFASSASRFGIGSALGGLTGAIVGSDKREGETKKDALRRGILRGMAVGGAGALVQPSIANFDVRKLKRFAKKHPTALKVMGGSAIGIPAAYYLKKHIEDDTKKELMQQGMI